MTSGIQAKAQEFERLHGVIAQEKGSLAVPKSQLLRAVRKTDGRAETLSVRVRSAIEGKLYIDLVVKLAEKCSKEQERS